MIIFQNVHKMRGLDPKTPPIRTIDDRVLATLFTSPTTPPLESRERGKTYHSICTSKGKPAPCSKERKNLEAARRASFVD